MDELELEITSLEPDERGRYRRVPSQAWRLAPDSSRLRMAITAGTAALVIIVALMLIPGGAGALATLFHHDTLAAPAVSGGDNVSIENGAPWGRLTIDGHPVDLMSLLEGAQALHLTAGQHTLVYTAEPFAPLRCQISAPAQSSDTCPLASPVSSVARVLDLGSSPPRLSPVQYSALVRTINAALASGSSLAMVTPGEEYLGPAATPATATVPLQARLTYSLDPQSSDASTPTWPADLCPLICKQHDLVVPGKNLAAWMVVARARASWSYTTPAGDTFSAPAAPATVGSDILLDVIAWWHHGWHAALNPTDPQRASCAIADAYAHRMRVVNGKGMGLRAIAAGNDASGCLVEAGMFVWNTAAAPNVALYMYRFGVLLAANDVAMRNTPDIPRADGVTRNLAVRLMP